jgi:hypothetical protein
MENFGTTFENLVNVTTAVMFNSTSLSFENIFKLVNLLNL